MRTRFLALGCLTVGMLVMPAVRQAAAAPCAAAITLVPASITPIRAFYGTHLEVALTATVTDTQVCTARLETQLVDTDGKGGGSRSNEIVLHPGNNAVKAKLIANDYGFYSVTVSLTGVDGTLLGSYSTTAASLRSLTELQRAEDPSLSPFGINTHFDQKFGNSAVLAQLMEMAGIRWARDSLDWNAVEPNGGGVYQIPSYDQQAIDDLTSHNISVLEMLGYFNSHYGDYASQEAGYKSYANYVANALSGRVNSFEIWNEPETFGPVPASEYPRVLEAGYTGVKSANPNATVVGLGGASPGGWSAWYFSAAAETLMDTFSIHPYTTPYTADVGYPTVGGAAPLANLDYGLWLTGGYATLIQEAQHLPSPPGIWITEMGWPTNYGDTNLAAQAQQVSRAYIMTAVHPELYKRIFIYQLFAEGSDPNNQEYNYGIVNNDYSVRPAYVAAATTTRALEGRPFIKKIDYPDDTIRIYEFGPEDDPVIVAWVTEVSPSALAAAGISDAGLLSQALAGSKLGFQLPATINLSQLGISSETISVHDWQDRERRIRVSKGSITVNLSTSPIFIFPVLDDVQAATSSGTSAVAGTEK